MLLPTMLQKCFYLEIGQNNAMEIFETVKHKILRNDNHVRRIVNCMVNEPFVCASSLMKRYGVYSFV